MKRIELVGECLTELEKVNRVALEHHLETPSRQKAAPSRSQIATKALRSLPSPSLRFEARDDRNMGFAHLSDALLAPFLAPPPLSGPLSRFTLRLNVKRPAKQRADVTDPRLERMALCIAKGDKPTATDADAHM